MRGQRLFTRTIEPEDRDAVAAFLTAHGRPADSPPSLGILGKVVGRLVAVATFELAPDAVVIRDLVVDPELRRKRIGRFMMGEVASLAAALDRTLVVVPMPRDEAAATFLRSIGFSIEGDVFIRNVAGVKNER